MSHIIIALVVLAILIGLACLLQWYQNHTKPLSTSEWRVVMRKHDIGVTDKTKRLVDGDPNVVGYSRRTPRVGKRNQSFSLAPSRPIIEIDRKTRPRKGQIDAKNSGNRNTNGGHSSHSTVHRAVQDGQRNNSADRRATHSENTGTNDHGTP